MLEFDRVELPVLEGFDYIRELLWSRCRLVVEPGAATPIAALISGRYRPAADENVVAVICGANVDPATL